MNALRPGIGSDGNGGNGMVPEIGNGGGNQGDGNGNQGGGNGNQGSQGGGDGNGIGNGNQGGGNGSQGGGNGNQGGGNDNQGRKLLDHNSGGGDRRALVQRFLVTAWLNFLANAQPAPPPDLVHEAIEWLNATAPGPVNPSDDVWSNCGERPSGGSGLSTRCGEQIKDDLEATFFCEVLPTIPPALAPLAGLPPDATERISVQCLQNVDDALAVVGSSTENTLDTFTASNALDSAYECASALSFVSNMSDSFSLRRLLSTDEGHVSAATWLSSIFERTGQLLSVQVPPNATLVAMGSAIMLGASVNVKDSMAGAHVVLPVPRDAVVQGAAIKEWSVPIEGASNFAPVSGVLEVQASSVGGQPLTRQHNPSMLLCEEGVDPSACVIQLQVPVLFESLLFGTDDPTQSRCVCMWG
ncbi:hypothetical protein DUNSADRAFT_16626 [Dunaliella salina]|uniref:Uncharacterized protein n=1 Tax=Dunaliella salina TaxID=3046 RepID=A0ABQ7G387_DUNSA|nr:hypothetical protein DUNSADRAFT_16626 [Dunaliella salina]|eukprot:KAF5829069.1 hypothetical protein DUNSADRAFT_16626 [Dunaliella salina]